MTYTVIPIQARANQTFLCVLDGQSAQISLTTTDFGLFADVLYNGQPVANGRLCLDRTDINPMRYNGLPQFLGFADTQGQSDPVYTGFGTRYLLIYGNPQDNGGTIGVEGPPITNGGMSLPVFILDQSYLDSNDRLA